MPEEILSRVATLDPLLPALAEAADALESDADAWRAVWSEPRMRAIAYLGVPEAMNPYPFASAGLGDGCGHALHLALVERLSRGAASTMMALPASALPTRAVRTLGTNAQIERFFAPFAAGEAWTFFGVTEPGVGSDASQVRTSLEPCGEGWHLEGTKALIGGALPARLGLVLAREPKTRALRLVIIDAHRKKGVTVRPLPMSGLVGAGLSELRFKGYRITPEDVLAADSRKPAMLTLANVFEAHRPMVGAMALGTVRAILDRLAERGMIDGFGDLARSHAALLRRMIGIGLQVEAGPVAIHTVSQFKRQATGLADATRLRLARLGPDRILRDARLRRLWRDAGAFEYMEGTTAIHRLNAYRDYLTGDLADDPAL